ncbi:unnamed protein product [Brachionus calyciflorus]|uniref:Uncharacterized protein n=1 Tax=Brachionus calyciflorus TaxID=104777 RepID=A0A814Q9Z6_9BILA|nr:unnamed protein product [Brachionus calyciflorus]
MCNDLIISITTNKISTETNRGFYFPTRSKNRTTLATTTRTTHNFHSINKLAIFLFCTILMSATILLALKIHYRKLWNNLVFKLYKSLPNENKNARNFNRLSFEGASTSLENEHNIDDIIELPETRRKRFNFKFPSLNFLIGLIMMKMNQIYLTTDLKIMKM